LLFSFRQLARNLPALGLDLTGLRQHLHNLLWEIEKNVPSSLIKVAHLLQKKLPFEYLLEPRFPLLALYL